ncbi:MAG: hypothetical protein ABI624_10825 [Casimicrobiaceae bacterium]
MRFKVIVGDDVFAVEVPEDVLEDGGDFFARLDRDMDRGWQMSREYVDFPDRTQRCQIAADKLLTSIINDHSSTATMMAAYIVVRAPGANGVEVDTTGEMQNTRLLYG